MTTIEATQTITKPDTRLRFDNKPTSWLVRAVSEDGRYALATASFGFMGVAYTIIDHNEQVRGAINVLGGGMGINTNIGADPQIDHVMKMLRPYPADYFEGHPDGRPVDPDNPYGSQVSHRNRVPLNITAWRTPDQKTWTS